MTDDQKTQAIFEGWAPPEEVERLRAEADRLSTVVASGVDDIAGAGLDDRDEEIERLRTALKLLEDANEQLCSARPQWLYDATIAAGLGDRLAALDNARYAARAALSVNGTPEASNGRG